MKIFHRERLKKLSGLLAIKQREPAQQAERTVRLLRDVVLPAKAGVSLVVLYYLFYSGWTEEKTAQLALDNLKKYFQIYLACNFVGAILLVFWRRLPTGSIQWIAFTLGLLDGLFFAGITCATGGFNSNAFFIFPGLIVLNALSIPLATPQIVLNLALSLFYVSAVLSTPYIGWDEELSDAQILLNMNAVRARHHVPPAPASGSNTTKPPLLDGIPLTFGASSATQLVGSGTSKRGTNNTLAMIKRSLQNNNRVRTESLTEDVVPQELMLRISVLWLLTLCCYGAQVLLERQRQALQEATEFAAREAQLHSAGRLAAEFVHQIKNPLAIINNTAYSLKRTLKDSQGSVAQQIEIIQEEVARADKVITQVMGYAQLSEGRVEKLMVVEEIERAVDTIFPAAVSADIILKKQYADHFPALLMQRGHLSEILINLFLNAREAVAGCGNITIGADYDEDQVVITVADDGPGVAPDKVEQIFEAYFTTKEKGTGLGLSIVKHNAELYGGKVRVDSMLGKGASFTVTLPTKSKVKVPT